MVLAATPQVRGYGRLKKYTFRPVNQTVDWRD